MVMQAVPRTRAGVTIIEGLIVVAFLALIVAIVAPRYTGRSEHAELAAVKSDLRNLMTAEQAYFSLYDTYTTSLPPERFQVSPGVTITEWTASQSAWRARATHAGLAGSSPSSCHVTVSTDTTVKEARGTPVCP
jgi:type IV pilus assembly protein PilA